MTARFQGEHPTPERLDEFVDVLTGRETDAAPDHQSLRDHCTTCPSCSDELGRLRAIRTDLDRWRDQPVSVPTGLATSITTAVQWSTSANPRAAFPPAGASVISQGIPLTDNSAGNTDGGTVTDDDITPLVGNVVPLPTVTRPRVTRTWLAAAAAAVVLIAGTGALVASRANRAAPSSATMVGQPDASDSPTVDAVAAERVLRISGVSYDAQALDERIPTLLASIADTPSPSLDAAQAGGSAPLLDVARLRGCLQALGLGSGQVRAIDLGKWNGNDAAVVVSTTSGNAKNVWVVSPNCGVTDDYLLHFAKVAG